ncbi:MAG TPA: ATP-binding protein [Burkholderiales bacterium]|nr:ATP-binding protein [Burkholderiales bacterium]
MGFIRSSIRRKTMAIALGTTLVALLVNGIALIAYEVTAFREAHMADLRTQAAIIGRATAAAIAFSDRTTAMKDLLMLSAREDIIAAAVYDSKGNLFAEYVRGGGEKLPPRAGPPGHHFQGDQVSLMYPVVEEGETTASVYLRGRTGLQERLHGYLLILGGVFALALGVAWAFSAWLQSTITGPIQHVAAAAREVVERRDYSVRARKTSDDEIGVLADGLNRMLADLEREIRERTEAEDALKVADRRKDEFLATLAHELRNPLAPIRNSLYLMKLTEADPQASAKARAVIERQVNQMVRLVDDLLDVSRITTGKLALRRERADLLDIVRSALEAVAPQAAARQLEVRSYLPSPGTPVNVDATRLSQVFTNLLSNAVKFSNVAGRIDFRVALEGDNLVASVADTGIGVAPETLARLFEIFTQADHSLERTVGGLGVGLWLSRRLVELHGGTLEGASEGLGKGAAFTVRIPGVALAREARPAAGATPGARPANASRKILIIDDNADFANTFAQLLRSMGEDAQVEYDGGSGLSAARLMRPEIVFLDIGMPGMNGYDVARQLRAAPETANCRLVAVTGWGQPRDRALASEAGFDEHMVKPLDLDRVRAILARVQAA